MKHKNQIQETYLIKELIEKELQKIRTQTTYLTRKEVSKMLKVDLSTIHNWTKQNILTSYGIGGRVYYKLEDVEKAIIKLNDNGTQE